MGRGRMIILFFVLVLLLSGCGKENQPTFNSGVNENSSEMRDAIQDEEKDNISSQEDREILDVQQNVEEEKQQLIVAPFLGKLVEKIELPSPIMVMIENSPAARPQIGLEDASIVYEFLVEGGITRFLALFYENFPERVGPVRSTRPYFIQTALEYDATLLHVGASAEGFHLLATSGISHIDQLSNGAYFWRDLNRRAPHNVYTGKSKLGNYLDKLDIKLVDSIFSFKSVSFIDQQRTKEADKLKIRYWGGYTVEYKYDASKGNYLRFIDSVPHLMEGGKKLYADNILVQYVDTNIKDDAGRLEMDLIGTGKALFFKNGYVFEGQWAKEADRVVYNGENGIEWQFNSGQTWIQIVPLSTKIDY